MHQAQVFRSFAWPMYDVCIFTALGWERAAVTAALTGLRRAGPRRWEAMAPDGRSCLLLQTGVGPGRAGAAALSSPPARCMIVCGCAGGLAPDLMAGAVVIADRVRDHDTGEEFATVVPPLAIEATSGSIVTTAMPLTDAGAKRPVGDGGALAVDMESAAIARVAAARSVPIVVARVVLDGARDTLPTADLVDETTGQLRLGAAVRYFLPPGRWSVALRLSRQQRAADRSLRHLARVLFPPRPGGQGLRAV